MDIDGLKRINDSHGHQAGDRAADAGGDGAAAVDPHASTSPARLGGDEFCVLAPEQESAARGPARRAARQRGGRGGGAAADPPVGLSIGVVSCPEHGDDAEALIDVADRAMYRAKAAGESVALGEPAGAETSPTDGAPT